MLVNPLRNRPSPHVDYHEPNGSERLVVLADLALNRAEFLLWNTLKYDRPSWVHLVGDEARRLGRRAAAKAEARFWIEKARDLRRFRPALPA